MQEDKHFQPEIIPTMAPSITVQLSTSSPTLDFSLPFTIKLSLRLNYDKPITFQKTHGTFFEPTRFWEQSLILTNLRTGEQISRRRGVHCTLGARELTPESDPDHFTTLHPGTWHIIEESVDPLAVFEEERAAAEKRGLLVLLWKGALVYDLKQGEVYDVGVSEMAKISWWREGTREQIVRRRGWPWWVYSLGMVSRDEVEEEPIKFHQQEAIRINVGESEKAG